MRPTSAALSHFLGHIKGTDWDEAALSFQDDQLSSTYCGWPIKERVYTYLEPKISKVFSMVQRLWNPKNKPGMQT